MHVQEHTAVLMLQAAMSLIVLPVVKKKIASGSVARLKKLESDSTWQSWHFRLSIGKACDKN